MKTPKVYVGTYSKYSNGSIEGAWLDLTDYINHDEFMEACAKLHSDEQDVEYMFQDFENFPKTFYSESSLDERIWDYVALDSDEREIVDAYLDHVDSSAECQTALDAYQGTYKDATDYAYELIESTGDLDSIPQHLRSYFDYESYARDIELEGSMNFVKLSYDKTMVFSNY